MKRYREDRETHKETPRREKSRAKGIKQNGPPFFRRLIGAMEP